VYTVLIRGLEFYAYHGVPAEERVIGHRYRVDLEMEIEGGCDDNDDVSETVDYGAAATQVVAIAQGHRCRTVEKLAKTIADRLIAEHVCIQRITVTLMKRLPPAPIIAEEAGVRLTVSR
jgi:dihydroneopterin aldolase